MNPATEAHHLTLRAGLQPMWTIYERPTDYPNGFIARLFVHGPGIFGPSLETVKGATLQEVRAGLPKGLFCMPRFPEDDPKIVEVWI
ncbi:hypothetical protein [Hyphomicrobium sp. 802]|uniref:hypothetical protein n=1 Tax=Hyphomicrobium sp. 802 TaxID=1112272 RepID=UPI0012DC0351|nr:hypothetical protein [Hyphomicrobium sp. 802]